MFWLNLTGSAVLSLLLTHWSLVIPNDMSLGHYCLRWCIDSTSDIKCYEMINASFLELFIFVWKICLTVSFLRCAYFFRYQWVNGQSCFFCLCTVYNMTVVFQCAPYHCTAWVKKCAHFSIYEGARFQPMREDITYVMSSLIGWELNQP